MDLTLGRYRMPVDVESLYDLVVVYAKQSLPRTLWKFSRFAFTQKDENGSRFGFAKNTKRVQFLFLLIKMQTVPVWYSLYLKKKQFSNSI